MNGDPAIVELLNEVLPYSPAVFRPPNLDRAYTECYGFSLEDIYAFGLKLVRQRWPRVAVLRRDENWIEVMVMAANEAAHRARAEARARASRGRLAVRCVSGRTHTRDEAMGCVGFCSWSDAGAHRDGHGLRAARPGRSASSATYPRRSAGGGHAIRTRKPG